MIQLPAEKSCLQVNPIKRWKEALTEIGQWMTQQGGDQSGMCCSIDDRKTRKSSVYIGNFVSLAIGTDRDEEVIEEGIYLVQECLMGGLWNKSRKPKIVSPLICSGFKREHQLAVAAPRFSLFLFRHRPSNGTPGDAETNERSPNDFEHGDI